MKGVVIAGGVQANPQRIKIRYIALGRRKINSLQNGAVYGGQDLYDDIIKKKDEVEWECKNCGMIYKGNNCPTCDVPKYGIPTAEDFYGNLIKCLKI